MSSETQHRIFENFSISQWEEWINRVLNREMSEPPVTYTSQEVHHTLAQIFNKLSPGEVSDRFGEAVASVFEATPLIEKYAAHLYHLLQLIGYIKPLRAKRMLRGHLFSEVLKDQTFGHQNLHTMMLVTRSKFDVDDELADYINRSARASTDFAYQIVCLRVISKRSQEEFVRLLDALHHFADSDIKAYQLARELKSLLRKYGAKEFCEWYTMKCEHLRLDIEGLENALEEIVFSDFELPHFEGKRDLDSLVLSGDPYRTLIGTQLKATSARLSPKQIIAVALLHKAVDAKLVSKTLVNIWRRISDTNPSVQPWFFMSGSPYINRKQVIISSGPVPNASEAFEFVYEEDPVATAILEAVKNACEVQIPLKFRAFV